MAVTRTALVVGLSLVGAGCAPPPEMVALVWPDVSKPIKQDLIITPANPILFVDTTSRTPAKVEYEVLTASGTDVSKLVTMSAKEPPFGDFVGNRFKSTLSRNAKSNMPGQSSLIGALSPTGQQGFAWSTLAFLRLSGTEQDLGLPVAADGTIPVTSGTFALSPKAGSLDLAIVMDTTGSMGGAIKNLKDGLQDTLFPQLKMLFPDARVAVVDHRDYDDWPVKVLSPMTAIVSEAATAVDLLMAGGGGDLPEAQVPAMHYVITGEPVADARRVPETPLSFGAVGFSKTGTPVLVLITDAAWHDVSASPFPSSVKDPPTIAQLQAAFLRTKTRFVNITVSGQEAQADALSDATNSSVSVEAFGGACGAGRCCTGVDGAARLPTGPGGTCRLNFLHNNGDGVTTRLLESLKSIARDSRYEVSMRVVNDPLNPNGLDVAKLVKRIRAREQGDPARGCVARPAIDRDGDGIKESFVSDKLEATLCFDFDLEPQTTLTQAAGFAQIYVANVVFEGQPSNQLLGTRKIVFVVPPRPLE